MTGLTKVGGSVGIELKPAMFYPRYDNTVAVTGITAPDALKDSSGLYWVPVSGSKSTAAGYQPTEADGWMCVGLLNAYPLNDSRAWYEPSSTVDNTVAAKLFYRTMSILQMTAVYVGDLRLSSRVTGYAQLDLSQCRVFIDPNSDNTVSGGGGKVFLIEDPDTQTLTGQSFATSNVGQVSHVQLSGAAYSNKTVGVIGEGNNNRAYLRMPQNTYIQAMDLYVMDGGTTGLHPDTPALFKFYDTSTFIIRPQRPGMVIKGGEFILEAPLSGGRSLRTCIAIERNNTCLVGGYFNAQHDAVIAESYVQFSWVSDIMVLGVSMPNGVASSNYMILCQGTNRLYVQHCHAAAGWALTDGNFMRNTVVEDSSGATIGCHAMAWNFTVRRCTIMPVLVDGNYQGGISLTGGGLLKVRDITYTYMGGPRRLDHPVSTRGDYGQSWEGIIDVARVHLRYGAAAPSGQGCAIVYCEGAYNGAIDLTRTCYLGGKEVRVRDVRVEVLNAAWGATEVVLSPVWFETQFSQTVKYPETYAVENFVVEGVGNNFSMDPRFPALVSNANAVVSTCVATFKNVQWPSTSAAFIGAAASTSYRVTLLLTIEDSRSSLSFNLLALPAGSKATIRRCTVGNLVLGNANSGGEYYLERNTVTGSNFGGSPAGSDKAYYYENHITTTNAVTIGSVAKYCHGNTVVVSGSITGRTLDEWYNYRDPTVFRTA